MVLCPAAPLAATASLIASVDELAIPCSEDARANGALSFVCAMSECCCGLCMVVPKILIPRAGGPQSGEAPPVPYTIKRWAERTYLHASACLIQGIVFWIVY